MISFPKSFSVVLILLWVKKRRPFLMPMFPEVWFKHSLEPSLGTDDCVKCGCRPGPFTQGQAVASQALIADADRSAAIRGAPGARAVEGEAGAPREVPAGPEPSAQWLLMRIVPQRSEVLRARAQSKARLLRHEKCELVRSLPPRSRVLHRLRLRAVRDKGCAPRDKPAVQEHSGRPPDAQTRSWRTQHHSHLLRRNAKGARPNEARRATQRAGRGAGRPDSVADRCHEAGREGKGSDARE